MTAPAPSVLPTPARSRWQPLRLGLVELFHYDSEEFWFRDGHLLLRGNNGTGKSKVLSLTLPFLFDAQLKSSRIEPDGDPGKKMAWNLLLGRHDRRMGYAWIEFGRLGDDGRARYVTLGCGLSAAAARAQVDSWFFLVEDQRIGQDLWLINPARVVLTRERLDQALQGRGGQVFLTAAAYRRAVDERLFHLGPARYAALMDTLIQLRQPQLSKKPDEGSLSNALSEALPPMSLELLTDVADALNQLEEYRRELDEYEALARAVGQFNQRYRLYAATQARRQARSLRGAQTGFDNASRTLNETRTALQAAQAAERQARQAHDAADSALRANRARHEQLLHDPAMGDAKQLDQASRDAQRRRDEAGDAQRMRDEALSRFEREVQASRARDQRVAQAAEALTAARTVAQDCAGRAGMADSYAANPLAALDAAGLGTLDPVAFDIGRNELRHGAATRREQVALVLRGCDEAERTGQAHAHQQQIRDERQDEAQAAAARRDDADAVVERQGRALLDAWQLHIDGLRQLCVAGDTGLYEALAAWVLNLQGDNPARSALHAAQQAASERLALQHAALTAERGTLQQERAVLQTERARIEQGEDAVPPLPHWRPLDARSGRVGAPLWQLVDFRPGLDAQQHAGLEAALQAAGLLDGWVTPDGRLHTPEGKFLAHDAHWLERPRQPQSLASWLTPAPAENVLPVPRDVLQRLLEGVAAGVRDDGSAEAWISPEGRFRLGALAGAWHKPTAVYIGWAARTAARARRLDEIAQRLTALELALARVQQGFDRHLQDRRQAAAEWQMAPADDAVRTAHAEAAARAREFQVARQRLDQAEQQSQAAFRQWEAARDALARDAEDLRLPATRDALRAIDAALQRFGEALHLLLQCVRELRDALIEQTRQRQREQEAEADAARAGTQWTQRRALADEARIRFETLRESIGVKVEELQQRLAQARAAVEAGEALCKTCGEALRSTGEARARIEQKSQDAEAMLCERTTTRHDAVMQLQGFAATGLLSSALPDADIPPLITPWTIEPALALARRAEQALAGVKDDDEAWNRVQGQVSQDYTELGRALSALSHQAQADTSDYGLVVTIVYQNRPERPDQLGERLDGEIAQRRELLTAGERKVLENHLQAEIAAAVQKLLRDAERQVQAINDELAKRPTSTGVRFRLQWQALPEGAEGAPVGLEAARKRLLNTSTDLWTAEDRGVVGGMLHQRILAERSRADAERGGSLLEHLPGRSTIAAGIAFASSAGKTENGAHCPVQPPAASARWA